MLVSRMLFFFILSVSVVATGCTATYTRGDKLEVKQTFRFFFRTGKQFTYQYLKISPDTELTQLILSNTSWSVSEGLILEDGHVELKSSVVEIREKDFGKSTFDREVFQVYKFEGLAITAKAAVRVSDSSSSGKKKIWVSLPGLGEVASALNAYPTFDEPSYQGTNKDSYNCMISLAKVDKEQYESEFARCMTSQLGLFTFEVSTVEVR